LTLTANIGDGSSLTANMGNTSAWGSTLVDSDKGDFLVDKESWQVNSPNTWSVADSALSVTYAGGAMGARIIFRDTMDLRTDLTPGDTYRARIRYKTNGAFKFRIYRGFGEDTVDSYELTSTTYQWVTLEWVCVNATGDDLRMTEFDAGDTVWIDKYYVERQVQKTISSDLTANMG